MHRRRMLESLAGLVLCPMCAAIGFAEEAHHWSYEGPTGPDRWGSLDAHDAVCTSGDQQSPVDVTGAISARQPPLEINWRKRPDTIVNNGHTIQLSVAAGDTLHLGGRTYGLKQFHFHHPSEHLVDGKRFAMEGHFVHAAEDGSLAVVGVFIVPGAANAAFHKIVATMPDAEGPGVAADPAIDPVRLIPAERSFYHYEGSLTTPPCDQTVDWLLFTHHVEVAEADIARFARLYPMNARPVQKLDRRFILSSSRR